MQVVITSRQEITAKSGSKYYLYKGLSLSGDTIEVFLNEDQEITMGVPASARATPDQISELFKSLPVIDVQFNQRGRLDTIQID